LLENNSDFEIPLADLEEITNLVLRDENAKPNSELTLIITEKGRIQTYNQHYRGVNKVTDVLAFPSEQTFLPFLGDIVIDIDICIEQKGSHSWQEELERLFLHGLLHLLGYEHVSHEQKKNMETAEKKYWNLYKESLKKRGR
jgi:probable rRNA maturation factor